MSSLYIPPPAGSLFIKETLITASGTWTPDPRTTRIEVWACGGGGGGGGADCANTAAVDIGLGGGASGSFTAYSTFTRVQFGDSQSVTIGAKGAGGSNAGGNGVNGGTTSLGSLLSITGGRGGVGTGTPSSGTPLVGRGSGAIEPTVSGHLFLLGAGNGEHPELPQDADRGTMIAWGRSGNGGHSYFGSGNRGAFITSNGTVFSLTSTTQGKAGYGGGGAGGAAISSTGGATGADGGDGCMFIREYQ